MPEEIETKGTELIRRSLESLRYCFGLNLPERRTLLRGSELRRYHWRNEMIHECANPECHTPFHYLHDGKLFAIYRPATSVNSNTWPERTTGKVEFAWLCGACAERLSVYTSLDGEPVIVQKAESPSSYRTGQAA